VCWSCNCHPTVIYEDIRIRGRLCYRLSQGFLKFLPIKPLQDHLVFGKLL
jgi:hypothetical protein